MKNLLNRSFQSRLFAGFLVISLIPLVLCSAMMLQIFRLRLADAAEQEDTEHLSQAFLAIDEAYSSFRDAADALQGDEVVADALSGRGDADDTQVYNRLFEATEGLRDDARYDLYDAEGNWRYSTQAAPLEARLSTNWGILYAARQANGSLNFAACDNTGDSGPLFQGAAALFRRDGEQVGYLLISLDYSNFQHLLGGKYGTQSDIILLSRYWRLVYCTRYSLGTYLAPTLRRALLDGAPLERADSEYAYRETFHEGTGLYLILRRPQAISQFTMRMLYTISITSALFCVAVSILMSGLISRQLFRPVGQLNEAISKVGQNNLDVVIPRSQGDELGQLAQRFNDMVAALKRNQEELVKNQRELNEAQIRMLQAQLNPHFLCNTLDTMKWIGKINNVPQLALLSTDLADILRFCISPDEFVPLWQEADILERYIEIQKIRLSGSFAFTTDLPPELEDCLIPKMILQPIVENAILHGLEGVENGAVRVSARERADGLLQISVTDNGKGLPPELVGPYSRQRRQTQGHLGLYNVDTILRKYYGEGFGLYLGAGPDGKGTEVSAVFPMQGKEKPEC